MKDSGIEWIGEIPSTWTLLRTKALYSHHKTVVGDKSDNYERLALTLNGVIKRSKEDSTGLQPEAFNGYQILRKDELVFKLIDLENISTSRVGLSPYEGLVSPAYIVLRPKENTFSKFGYYHYLSMWHRNIFNHMGDDGVRSSLNASDLLGIPCVVPPLDEQHRIADFLDRKCAEIDRVLEKTRASIEEYKKLKQSVITQAVTKGIRGEREMKDSGIEWIGEIPSTWNIVKGKYRFRERNSRGNNINLQLLSPTQKYGVIPQNLYEELTGMKAVKLDEKADLSTFKTIYSGDFCISLRSFQGGFEYSEYNGVVSPAYHVFYGTTPLCNHYFKYLFKTKSFIEKMASLTKTFRDGKSISFTDFSNSLIPIPPLEEQHSIADFLDRKCAEIDTLISKKEQFITEIEAYKKSLIYEYVTGKKEVQ